MIAAFGLLVLGVALIGVWVLAVTQWKAVLKGAAWLIAALIFCGWIMTLHAN